MVVDIKKDVALSELSSFKIGGPAKQLVQVSSPEEIIQAVDYAVGNKLKFRLFAGGTNIVFPDEGIDYLLIHNKGGKIEKILVNEIYSWKQRYESTLSRGVENLAEKHIIQKYPSPNFPQVSQSKNSSKKKNMMANVHEKGYQVALFLIADPGVALMDVVNKANSFGYAGLEKLAGIPGTIGGAVFGNAGAYGAEIADVVCSVEIYDGKKRKWLTNKACHFSYRNSAFKNPPDTPNLPDFPNPPIPPIPPIILRVLLAFPKTAPPETLQKTSARIVATREKKYPPGLACPGSFFKNLKADELTKKQLSKLSPEKIVYGKVPAGYLLEEVGAKNMQVGGIRVFDYHANLICNTGNGTAADVKKLAKVLKKKVKEKFGIELEEEIRYF